MLTVSPILVLDEKMVVEVSRGGCSVQRFNKEKPITRGGAIGFIFVVTPCSMPLNGRVIDKYTVCGTIPV